MDQGKKKILVVDDEQFIREFYQELLAGEGFSVIVANNGQEGINLAAAEKPDLVLLDIMMPDMDGLTVYDTLKAKFASMPIIYLTNAGETSNLLTAMKQNAAGFLIKSNIKPEDLVKRIHEVLSGNYSQNTSAGI